MDLLSQGQGQRCGVRRRPADLGLLLGLSYGLRQHLCLLQSPQGSLWHPQWYFCQMLGRNAPEEKASSLSQLREQNLECGICQRGLWWISQDFSGDHEELHPKSESQLEIRRSQKPYFECAKRSKRKQPRILQSAKTLLKNEDKIKTFQPAKETRNLTNFKRLTWFRVCFLFTVNCNKNLMW